VSPKISVRWGHGSGAITGGDEVRLFVMLRLGGHRGAEKAKGQILRELPILHMTFIREPQSEISTQKHVPAFTDELPLLD